MAFRYVYADRGKVKRGVEYNTLKGFNPGNYYIRKAGLELAARDIYNYYIEYSSLAFIYRNRVRDSKRKLRISILYNVSKEVSYNAEDRYDPGEIYIIYRLNYTV